MPEHRDYRKSSYIKDSHSSSHGLFDLPSGAPKHSSQHHHHHHSEQNQQYYQHHSSNKVGFFDLPSGKKPQSNQKKSLGFSDLPSGRGKKEAIERQQEMFVKREFERQQDFKVQNENNKRRNSARPVSYSDGRMPMQNGPMRANRTNLETDVSRSSINTAGFYLNEIGFFIKPLFYYTLATIVYIILGSAGICDYFGIKLSCVVVFAVIMFLGGITVNRKMSGVGFGILGVINIVGAFVVRGNFSDNSTTILRRLLKVLNMPYTVFTTNQEVNHFDSTYFVVSLVLIFGSLLLGTLINDIIKKRKKEKIKADNQISMGQEEIEKEMML